jgi:5-methylcytosine-specific restriction endonuclease McrA
VLRRIVLERDAFCCQYCGCRKGKLTCDYLLPVSRGGAIDLENLVAACSACSTSKGAKTLTEWLIALAQQPVERSA